MTDVKRYHSALITEVGEPGRSRLPQFVRAEDFELMAGRLEVADAGLRHAGEVIEKLTAERDQLQRDLDARDQENDLLRGHVLSLCAGARAEMHETWLCNSYHPLLVRAVDSAEEYLEFPNE